MECFLVFYANGTGTQLGARHQNVPFKSNVFVMLEFQHSRLSSFGIEAPPSMAVYLNTSLRESTCACLARRTYPQLRTLFYDIGGGTRAECGVGVARLRKKVIRVAYNQGVETSHANPNRLNQWYQTTLVRLPFKASLPAFGIGEPRGQDPQEPSVVLSQLCERRLLRSGLPDHSSS